MRIWFWSFVFLLAGCTAAAQIPGAQVPAAQTPPAQTPPTPDPLGRETPRGTIVGFTDAVHRDDLVRARAFMQLSDRQRENADALAQTLTTLLNRYFHRLGTLSASPAGDLTDGLPPDQDAVVLDMPDGEATILLKRIKDKQAGEIWLISSESLNKVPALGRNIDKSWLERHAPAALTEHSIFGVPLSTILWWNVSVVIPLLALWLVYTLLAGIVRRSISNPALRARLDVYIADLRWLTIALLTIVAHTALMPVIELSVPARVRDLRVSLIAGVVVAAALGVRFMGVLFDQARMVAVNRGRSGAESLVLLFERVAKVLIIVIAILAMLRVFGVNTTTALAGLGLGGVAIALGAQKSVENLIGAISLLTDHAIAVGDFCSVGGRVGWIEDITLRSVRLRTLEQTLLSIPAGALSQANIENFTTRKKILLQTLLRLRYGTTVMQLHTIIDQIHDLLVHNPDLDGGNGHVKLVNFSQQAIEIELFAYVKTTNYDVFLAVRENVLLAAAAVVESAGSAFTGLPVVAGVPSPAHS